MSERKKKMNVANEHNGRKNENGIQGKEGRKPASRCGEENKKEKKKT